MIWLKKSIKGMVVLLLTLFTLHVQAQNYLGKSIKFNLFSSTPIEDIKAVSRSGSAVLVAKTREIAIQVPITTFEFDKKLMQEHFNEDYMESDKYPYAKFKGIIDQPVDFHKDGIYPVTVTGMLSVHGVEKKRSVSGKLTISGGAIQIYTEFKVACVDHKIKIPSLIVTKIAEVIDVKVEGKLEEIKN